MTSDELLRNLKTKGPAPAYLFIGPEQYSRRECRRALIERVLPPEDRESGFIRHDLAEVELAAVLDEAQSFSLFVQNRIIWAMGSESALPRGRASASADEGGEAGDGKADGSRLASYLRNPTPGTVLVFDCARYELEGDEKVKVQRVQKFYSPIRDQVEFARYSPEMTRRLGAQLAKEKGLNLHGAELELLVEVVAGDAQRIANEIEKLALYTGSSRAVTEQDIWNLTPDAKSSTIFALVNAMARRDRIAALESLDVLVREGEYLPLALSFLGTQFRLAAIAKEARLTNASQIQAWFSKQGTAMWRSRAEQVAQTIASFSGDRLKKAVLAIYATDKALRDTRPDDRTVMEKFVLDLTGA